MSTLLPLNTGFNEQPCNEVAIDRSHRLTNGLILSAYNSVRDVGRLPINYVNGVIGTGNAITKSAPAIAVPRYGTWNSAGDYGVGSGPAATKINGGAKFNGTTSWARLPLDLAPYHDITVALWLNRIGSTASIILEYGVADWTNEGWLLDQQDNPGPGSFTMLIGAHKSSNGFLYLLTQIEASAWHHHIFTMSRDSGASVSSWRIDGAPASSNGTGSPPTLGNPWSTNQGLNICSRNSGTSSFSANELCGLQIWNRLLRTDEQIAVYREGWRMFKPVRRAPFPLIGVASAASVQSWFLVQ